MLKYSSPSSTAITSLLSLRVTDIYSLCERMPHEIQSSAPFPHPVLPVILFFFVVRNVKQVWDGSEWLVYNSSPGGRGNKTWALHCVTAAPLRQCLQKRFPIIIMQEALVFMAAPRILRLYSCLSCAPRTSGRGKENMHHEEGGKILFFFFLFLSGRTDCHYPVQWVLSTFRGMDYISISYRIKAHLHSAIQAPLIVPSSGRCIVISVGYNTS